MYPPMLTCPSAQGILTNVNLCDHKTRVRVDSLAQALLGRSDGNPRTPRDRELVLQIDHNGDALYYFASWERRVVFWLEEVSVDTVTGCTRPVVSPSHLRMWHSHFLISFPLNLSPITNQNWLLKLSSGKPIYRYEPLMTGYNYSTGNSSAYATGYTGRTRLTLKYRVHVQLFPNHRRASETLIQEVKDYLLYARIGLFDSLLS